MALPVVDVAVSVVRSPEGRVLLAERTAGQVAPGFWELPGGKIDPGETPSQAAARELEEEIGIVPTSLSPWMTYEHAFRTKRVRLHLFRVEGWRGNPHGREGQRLAWVDPAAPAVGPVLPSNDRAVAALGLSPVLLDVDPTHVTAGQLRAALQGGARMILLRAAKLSGDQRLGLARRMIEVARSHNAVVLIDGALTDARRAAVEGLHSSADRLSQITERPAVRLWSVCCRDAEDLARAEALGADLAVVPRSSGWDGLRRLAADSPVPVYAIGGLSAADLPTARAAGCAGIVVDCL